MGSKYLVTGGTGFLGSSLVKALLREGHGVRVLDNNLRGRPRRLAEVEGQYEFVEADIRDPVAVMQAAKGVDGVWHLAFVNGTEFFYTRPELVLDVGVRGMVNVLDACRGNGIGELFLASSSEVYQTPPRVPTDETVPLSIPDVLNPRYSYASGKLISEVMAINYGRTGFRRVVIFRPHNVYGPDMGWEHVIPQLALRVRDLCKSGARPLNLPIQGSGRETRAFVYVDDFTAGLMTLLKRGEHLQVYHVGCTEEVTVEDLALRIGRCLGHEITVVPGKLAEGGTPRRCPDIAKISRLGYQPQFRLDDGLPITVRWYDEHAELRTK